ncbi:MAG: GntR family transcriptional regulator [Rhodobacteraceae bacterium]|nr:GntR family transcriptional regulator [Paracoccaceae bacterium]
MNLGEFFAPQGWLDPAHGPRYLQLRRHIEGGITAGSLPPGSALPPERDIATMSGLSRVTVRKAIEALVKSEKIIQRRGSGSFVAARDMRVEQSLSSLTSFTEDMASRGMNVSSLWLERGLFRPTAQEIKALDLSGTDSVARIARLRSADGTPLAIERASLSPEILPNPLLVKSSLYEVLDRTNHRPVRALQRITAGNPGQEDAALLGVDEGQAVLIIERTSYLESGRVVEFTQSIYRGDKYDFVAYLQLAKTP